MDPRRNKKWLENAYKTKSAQEIADEIGVSYATISRDLKKYGIKTRTRKEWLKLRPDTYTNVLKKNWSKESYRDKMSTSFSKRWEDDDYSAKMTKIAKEKWDDPAYRAKMEKVYASSEYRQKMSGSLKEIWEDEDYKDKMAVVRAAYPMVSSYAATFYDILDDLKIHYYREYNDKLNDLETVVGPWNIDCVIPRANDRSLLVEVNGPPHEFCEKRIENDRRKHAYITNYMSHKYELKYVWYHEFGCQGKISELIRHWTNTKLNIIDFEFSKIEIKKADRTDVKRLIGKYYYLPFLSQGGYLYGAYLDGELIATCVFSIPTKQTEVLSLEYKSKNVRELSRFCIHPNYQKENFGSWVMSRCIEKLCIDYPKCDVIVSYCDKVFDDLATYIACGFKQNKILTTDDWYIKPDGWVMHEQTLHKKAAEIGMNKIDFAKSKNYTRVCGIEKYQLVYALRKRLNSAQK